MARVLRLNQTSNRTRTLEFHRSPHGDWIIHFKFISPKSSQHEEQSGETNHSTVGSMNTNDSDLATVVTSFFELKPEETVNPYVYRKCLIRADFPHYSFFFQNIFTWIDASAQVILPFIIMLVCNVNIIHKVLLTKNRTNGRNVKRLRKIKGLVKISIEFIICQFLNYYYLKIKSKNTKNLIIL